jgi:hypothetical protein
MTSPTAIILLLALGGAGYYAYKAIEKNSEAPALSVPSYAVPATTYVPKPIDPKDPSNILLPSGALVHPIDIPTFSFIPTTMQSSTGGSIFSLDIPWYPKNIIPIQ